MKIKIPLTRPIAGEKVKGSKARKYLEATSWVIGIIGGLLIIWQTLFPKIFNRPEDKKAMDRAIPDTSKHNIQPPQSPNKLQPKKAVKKSPKYKINGPVTNSAIGDNASVINNFYGKPEEGPRHLNQIDTKRFDGLNMGYKVSLWMPMDEEGSGFGNELYKYLSSKGFAIELNEFGQIAPEPIDKRFDLISDDNSKSIKITIPNKK